MRLPSLVPPPALLAVAIALHATAGVGLAQPSLPSRGPDEWMPATPFAGLVALAPIDSTVEAIRLDAQLAAPLPADRAMLGVRIAASRLSFTATREVRAPVSTTRPFVGGLGVAVDAGRWSSARGGASGALSAAFVPEVNVATFDGSPHWLLGARVPVTAARRAGRLRLRALLSPAVAWGDVRPRACTDTGPGDGCGDFGVHVAFGRTRWLLAGALGLDDVTTGVGAHLGVQRVATSAQRTVFALGVSWSPQRRRR
jgi:hypothetical protein